MKKFKKLLNIALLCLFYSTASAQSDSSSVKIISVVIRGNQINTPPQYITAFDSQTLDLPFDKNYTEKMASMAELTSGIAHEIQNPLNFVNNFSELNVDLAKELKEELEKIKMPNNDKAYIDEILTDLTHNQEKIQHHGLRASNIVKGMLEHSSKSTGIKEPTDINALIKETLPLSMHNMKSKMKSFSEGLPIVNMDLDGSIGKMNIVPQDMSRVLLNLFNNAFYAVHQHEQQLCEGLKTSQSLSTYIPSVSVTTKRENGKIKIIIKDNGSGIPDNIRQKIFQPFFTTKPTGEGTGLGLSLAYDIVTKGHGGTLKVLSTVTPERDGAEGDKGVGSEFIIKLPI